ncbi:MAG: hypothetical protein JW717_08365 [Marinilabiliaceae bacterium]|nr:hypothetical protein [Marinilabiliaceae bacterium]
MKKIKLFLIAIFVFLISPLLTNSQEDKLLDTCSDYFQSPFITTGQPMKAFLTGDEVAEFHTTLYEGSIYRLVTCSRETNLIQFSVFDKDHNLLFSSNEHVNVDFWDFKMEGSIECIIEARLNSKKATSGIAMLMLGFKGLSY